MVKKIFLSLIILIAIIGGFYGYKLLKPAVQNAGNKYFYIQSGDELSTVKKNLISNKFIDGSGFDLVSRLLKYKKVKPGRYQLKDGLSLYKLVKLLRSGKQALVKMVIVKERTKEGFAGKIGKGNKFDFECDSLQMINYITNNDSLKKFGVDTNTVMTLVMPYTYSIKWNSTPEDIVQQFYTAYKKFWTEERRTKADSIQLTPTKAIILASIIDEETNKKNDKLNIASTYLNRLRIGMKLQADPTARFATRDFKTNRITGKHLRFDSPYNTYIYAGLPPGPICTPSLESINSVLDAPQTDYLYFVASSKFDGSTIFTSNYNDHLKFAKEYQRELTRRIDSSRKAKAGK